MRQDRIEKLYENAIKQAIREFIEEHELDFMINKVPYKYQHGTTPHKEVPNFKPKVKPLIMYKTFKLRLDNNGNNLAKGYVFPLYVNTEEEGYQGLKSKGLKLGVWYKSGEGACWVNTKTGRSYTKGKGYGTDGQIISVLAYRPGWHLTNTPWGNQRGASKVTNGIKGTGNNYRNTWDSEVWAKVEICVDVDATNMAKQRAIELMKSKSESLGKPYKEGSYDPIDACLDKMGEDYYYLYKTNSNATDDQSWYIVDKIRIVEILDDDQVDSINDKFYSDLSRRSGKRINNDPTTYTTANKDEIPYWKMPRLNGKRYTTDDLKGMGYEKQPLSQGDW